MICGRLDAHGSKVGGSGGACGSISPNCDTTDDISTSVSELLHQYHAFSQAFIELSVHVYLMSVMSVLTVKTKPT